MNGPVVFVTGGEGGGGVLSFVRDLAPAVADCLAVPVIHLGLVNCPVRRADAPRNYSVETLGMDPAHFAPGAACRHFLEWIERCRPCAVILNDVSQINEAWPHLPTDVRLIVVLHDEAMRFRKPLLTHAGAVDRLVVVASYLERLVAADRPDYESKTVVIHNGARFPAGAAPIARSSFTNRNLEILYVGGMDYFKKGIQDLPKLARALKRREVPFRLTIIGGRDERLARSCARYGISDSVEWRGRVGADEVLNAAGRADFFFLPSRCEPFGMVTIEAMGMGAIPFAYDIESGSREIVEHGKSGWLFPLADVEAVAKGMQEVMRDEALCQHARRNAIERARSVFPIERAARQYADAIRTVVAQPAPRLGTETPLGLDAAPNPAPMSCRRLAESTGGTTDAIRQVVRAVARAVLERFPSLVQPFWRRYG